MHARHKLERMPQATAVRTIDLYLELHTLLIRISIVFNESCRLADISAPQFNWIVKKSL
jgi:hypothetical protein